jgi:hypothetical protein
VDINWFKLVYNRVNGKTFSVSYKKGIVVLFKYIDM